MMFSFLSFSLFFLVILEGVNHVWGSCLPTVPVILDDVHDGDQKEIKSVEWDTFIIRPYPNVTQWQVEGKFDINCVAIVDFNVSGKSDYPPVPLMMTMWVMQSDAVPSAVKLGFEFTDPSETLAPRTHPLNIWTSSFQSNNKLDLRQWGVPSLEKVQSSSCLYNPHGQAAIFNDILAADMKAVTVNDEKLEIEPYDNKESWIVESTFSEECVAMVNFNVPNYPPPPGPPQVLVIWRMASIYGANKDAMVFTKPSNGLPLIGTPIDAWLPENESKK